MSVTEHHAVWHHVVGVEGHGAGWRELCSNGGFRDNWIYMCGINIECWFWNKEGKCTVVHVDKLDTGVRRSVWFISNLC
jgi:hypothetical protein